MTTPAKKQDRNSKPVKKPKDNLTEGNVLKGLVLYALPLLGSGLIQQLYSTVDLIFVGHLLGTESAAAIGASDLLITCLVGFFTGMAVGTSVYAARHFGAEDWGRLGRLIRTMFWTGFLGGLLLLLGAELFAPFFLRKMGTPQSIYPLAMSYLRIYILSMPGVVLYNLESGMIRSMGDSRTPMLFQLIGGIVNVFADFLFIVVFHMGVEGTAIATVMSQTCAALCAVVYLRRIKHSYALSFWPLRLDGRELVNVLRVGVPSGIQSIIITLSNIIIQSRINTLGVKPIASFTVYFKAEMMLYLPVLALGQAAVAFIGQNIGAGNSERLKKGSRICLFGGGAFTFAQSMVMLLLMPVIVGIFTADPEVKRLASQIMMTTYPFYFLCTLLEVLSADLRGHGDALSPMLVVIFSYCGFRIFMLLELIRRYHSVRSVAVCYPLSWGFAVAFMTLVFLWKRRKRTVDIHR